MSPSEADLRAALREGEGDGVDPYDIIWSVRQARARRRSMLLSAAAAVVVVSATAAGVTALVHGAGSPNSGMGGGAQGSSLHRGGNTAAGSVAASVPARKQPQNPAAAGGRQPGRSIALTCAAFGGSFPSPHNAHASGSLLPGPVKEFHVCAYANLVARASAVTRQLRITGPAAGQLAESLRHLSATSFPTGCPAVTSTGNTALDIVPITPTGQRLPTITAKIGLPACATMVTNGLIVRYGWHLPPRVAARLSLPNGSPGTFQLIPPARGESGAPPR